MAWARFKNFFRASNSSNYTNLTLRPSKHFCKTGNLAPGEVYDQKIYRYGNTRKERCPKFYPGLYNLGGGKKKSARKKKTTRRKKTLYKNRKSIRYRRRR